MGSPERTGRDDSPEAHLETELLREIVHGLRSPLGVSTSAMDELAANPGGDQGRLLQLARRSLGRIAHLADQLEWVAELESGRIELRRDRLDLSMLVRDSLSTLGSRTDSVVLECVLPSAQHHVWGDRRCLLRACQGILDNAARFARTRVRVAVLEEDGWATLLVDDDGRGVSEARREIVFDRHLSARRRGADGDLALGLSIARDCVQLHGGSVVLQEAPGGGSRARLALPTAPTSM